MALIKKRDALYCRVSLIFVIGFATSSALAEGITNTEKPLFGICKPAISSLNQSQELSIDARAAEDRGDIDLAATYALTAACEVISRAGSSTEIVDPIAYAVERLLDADNVALADQLISYAHAHSEKFDADNSRQIIHLKLAAARLLSFRDKNSESLAIRKLLADPIERTFGSLSQEFIENQLRIANLELESGNLARCLHLLNDLDHRVAGNPSVGTRLLFSIYESGGIALAIEGKEQDAIERLNSLKEKFRNDARSVGSRELDIDEEIASILFREERFDDALILQSEVFLKREALFPTQEKRLKNTIWRLASFYTSNQRTDAAKAILLTLERDLRSNESTRQSQLYWQTLSRLASIDARGGNFLDAEEKWHRVYSGESAILGEDALDTQIEKSNYATALAQIGQTKIACPMLADVLDREMLLRPDDLWAIEFTRISLSRCLLREKNGADIERARQLLLNSWAELESIGDASGPSTLIAIATLASADLLLARRAEAKALLANLVRNAELSRSRETPGLPLRDSEFFTWIDGFAVNGAEILGYRELALLHAQDDELERALRISELARDRTLTDRFAEQAWFSGALPAAEQHRLEPLLDQIQALDERIAVTTDLMERVRLESERTIAVAQRGRLEKEISRRVGVSEPEPVPPTLDALRARLDSDAALVSVVHSPDAWWALVIRRDAPARFVALPAVDLGRTAAAWVQRLRGEPVRAWPLPQGRLVIDDLRPQGAVGGFLNGDQLGARLSSELLAPLLPALGAARHLVFVGDDELVGVPLQALPLGNGLAVDAFDVTYAPSLTTYARWQGRRSTDHARDLLAVGAVEALAPAPPPGDDSVAMGLAYAADHPLPHARDEIDAIAALFPRERRRLMTGSQARKASLRRASQDGELAGYRYVHFATHAWADPEQPEASAVVLSGEGTQYPLQRVLTAAELAGLHMRADLIVLSGCDTGAGHFEHGRGLLGLAYAALAAGNRAAVISLWPIADDTTAPFMARFYARLRRGQGPAAAMAATQREFRASADPRRASPAAWAAFMVYGGY